MGIPWGRGASVSILSIALLGGLFGPAVLATVPVSVFDVDQFGVRIEDTEVFRSGTPVQVRELSFDADGDLVSIDWDFADGTLLTTAPGVTFLHTYMLGTDEDADGDATCDGVNVNAPIFPLNITHVAVDALANTNRSNRSIILDDAKPTTTLDVPPPDGDNGWYVDEPVQIGVSRADPCTGVEYTEIRVDGDLTVHVGFDDFRVNVEGEGEHELTARSRDIARNVEAFTSATISIDTQDPDTPLTLPCLGAPVLCIGSSPISGVFLSGDPVTFEADASDDGSGVATVQFLVDEIPVGAPQGPGDGTYTTTWFAAGAGLHEVAVLVTDVAGLADTDTTVIVVVE